MEKNELIDKTIALLQQMKDLPKSVNLEEENRFLKEKLAFFQNKDSNLALIEENRVLKEKLKGSNSNLTFDELYTSGKMPYAEYKIKITELNRMKNIEMFRELE